MIRQLADGHFIFDSIRHLRFYKQLKNEKEDKINTKKKYQFHA